jgi:hypothetical protein
MEADTRKAGASQKRVEVRSQEIAAVNRRSDRR